MMSCLCQAAVATSRRFGRQSPGPPEDYANGSDSAWQKCVVFSARFRAIAQSSAHWGKTFE
jgi:hypothetical protein